MKTTLRKILSFHPCGQDEESKTGWNRGVKAAIEKHGKLDLDTEVTPMGILKATDIKDAVWCLCAFDYKDYCLFLADIAESVVPIYEKYNKNSLVLKRCTFTIRLYADDAATKEDLDAAADAADAAAYAAADAEKWQEIEQLFVKHFGDK